MDIDETTCWYNKNLYKSANKSMGQATNLRPRKILEEFLGLIPADKKTVIDLGCGNAVTSKVIGEREYTGLDLPHNIETMCESTYPNLSFIKCDVVKDKIGFISEYDIVLMRSFLDVMQYPLQILNKILKSCRGYVILQNQEIVEGKTNVVKNPAYNGFTYRAEISKYDFDTILKWRKISVIRDVDAGMGIWRIKKKHILLSGEIRSFLLLTDIISMGENICFDY